MRELTRDIGGSSHATIGVAPFVVVDVVVVVVVVIVVVVVVVVYLDHGVVHLGLHLLSWLGAPENTMVGAPVP